MEEYEDRLKLVEKFLMHRTILSDIIRMLDEIIKEDHDSIEVIKNKLKKIKIFIEKLD